MLFIWIVGLSYALSANIESIPVTELDTLEEMDRWWTRVKSGDRYHYKISSYGSFLTFPSKNLLLTIVVACPSVNLQMQEHGPAAQEARKIDVDSVMETS